MRTQAFYIVGALALCSCNAMQKGSTFEVGAGGGLFSGKGESDIQKAGVSPALEIGGQFAAGELTGAAGEWWIGATRIDAGSVDGGDLGTFDLSGQMVEGGIGVRVPLARDLSLGLGGCVVVAHGEASSDAGTVDADGSGGGGYAALTYSRDLSRHLAFFARVRYVVGPDAEINAPGFDDEEVSLSHATLTVGVGLRP